MNLFITVLLCIGGFLLYIFTCVIASFTYPKFNLTQGGEDTPLVIIWPFVILFVVFLYWPINGMVWICHKMASLGKGEKASIVK
jgi:hypothetical protein